MSTLSVVAPITSDSYCNAWTHRADRDRSQVGKARDRSEARRERFASPGLFYILAIDAVYPLDIPMRRAQNPENFKVGKRRRNRRLALTSDETISASARHIVS